MPIRGADVLQMFEDDDVGPDKDAYRKALKSRKWLVLSATVLSAVSLGLYKGFPPDTSIVVLPAYLLFKTALATTLFLSIQFTIHLTQVFTVYRSLLENRLFAEHQNILTNFGNELFALEQESQGLSVQLADPSIGPTDKAELARKERSVRRLHNLTKERLRLAEQADPRHNKTFTALEVTGDVLRMTPAAVLAALAIGLAVGSEHWITFATEAGLTPPPAQSATEPLQ